MITEPIRKVLNLITSGAEIPDSLKPYERDAREILIRRAFDRAMQAGLTINGVTLLADPDSLALFTGLAAFLSLGLTTQAITPETPQTLYGADDSPVTAPAAQVAALLLAYGAAYAAAFNAMKAQIAALD
jgi:hypothetical protein